MRVAVPDVQPFRSHLPVRVSFGDGAVGELTAVARGLGASTALVVIEEPVAAIEAVAAALSDLERAGVAVERYVKPPGEPTFDQVEDAAAHIARANPGVLIAVGGGSALDLAKAARLVHTQGGPLGRFAGGAEPVEEPSLPLVTIPTTSGTGSEVSGGAVITDKAEHRKVGFANPLMRAQHALVDPLLTLGLPPGATAQTGVDALAQAIGGVIVTNGNPLSLAIGLESCRYVAAGLERAVADGSDRDARRAMSMASLLGGLAMNLSDCAADHALGQAIGGRLGLPHGLTIGIVLAETLDVSRVDCAGSLERVADALDEPSDGTADGSRAVRAVRRILASIDFPTASDAGVTQEHLDDLVPLAHGEYFLTIDPHRWSQDDIRRAYEGALALDAR